MTATVAGSQAALKVLYPNGELPKSINEMFVGIKRVKKETDFVGELAYIPIQNANPQGSSADFTYAQLNIQQGNYLRMALTRVQHHGIARITGEAAEAAVKSEGALVDLWDNETRGIATTEMSTLATYFYGTGDGVLGRVLSGYNTVTLTLYSTTNMNYFELGQSLRFVSATGVSPSVRVLASGTVQSVITGIDRRARTLTFAVAPATTNTSMVNDDYIVRSGDQASSARTVITGLGEYIAGGTAPGSLFGLTRSADPVRLAGQSIDYAGWAMEDAVVDASAQAGFQGIGYPNVLLCNNIEVANMKKSLGSKIIYNDGGGKAKHSFSGVSIDGEAGPIEIVADPFCPRNTAFLVKLDAFSLFSLKAAPHLNKFDGMDFLRRPDADAFEVRFVFYGNLKCKNPGPHVKLTNFGL
ncbi:hypothetical protein [Acidithiobacillus sp.]|uniref:hypothetical protein n=1 Tax=Acidithiobacillus sp. TaxID=1872118 RepID=UPI00258B55C5|nr:hypothetical protein [Acidithiobacillus sp.]MDD5374480.1 hypothetical protein [Acidithiobacillus sp.]